MIYREQSVRERYVNPAYGVGSKRRIRPGIFVILSLGVSLALCMAYIIYSNGRAQSEPIASVERSLRILAPPATMLPSLPPVAIQPSPFHHSDVAVTVVPQSRAGNAFLGGRGPAVLREEARESVSPVEGF